MKILQISLLILILSIAAFAQNKIAVIDTDAFYEKKTGISELITGIEKLDQEFGQFQKEFNALREKLEKTADELKLRAAIGHSAVDELYSEAKKNWKIR
jgi:Skp family chaperone for outer membrane proteins